MKKVSSSKPRRQGRLNLSFTWLKVPEELDLKQRLHKFSDIFESREEVRRIAIKTKDPRAELLIKNEISLSEYLFEEPIVTKLEDCNQIELRLWKKVYKVHLLRSLRRCNFPIMEVGFTGLRDKALKWRENIQKSLLMKRNSEAIVSDEEVEHQVLKFQKIQETYNYLGKVCPINFEEFSNSNPPYLLSNCVDRFSLNGLQNIRIIGLGVICPICKNLSTVARPDYPFLHSLQSLALFLGKSNQRVDNLLVLKEFDENEDIDLKNEFLKIEEGETKKEFLKNEEEDVKKEFVEKEEGEEPKISITSVNWEKDQSSKAVKEEQE